MAVESYLESRLLVITYQSQKQMPRDKMLTLRKKYSLLELITASNLLQNKAIVTIDYGYDLFRLESIRFGTGP